MASVGPAVFAAAKAARDKPIAMAVGDASSPLHGLAPEAATADNGWLMERNSTDKRELMVAMIAPHGGHDVTAESSEAPGDEKKQYSMHSFGAVFVEVHVDPDLGTIRVPRVVGAYGVGKLMNKKTGHSQLMGGIVRGARNGTDGKNRDRLPHRAALERNLADYQ